MRKFLPFFLLAVTLIRLSDSYGRILFDKKPESLNGSDKKHNSSQNKEDQNFDLSYSIEPFYDINVFRFNVILEFQSEKSGEIQILLPGNPADWEDKSGVKFLKALSPGTSILDTERPEVKTIKYIPGSPVKICYQIEQTHQDEITFDNHYMPIITKRYFHVFSDMFFVIPIWSLTKEFNIRIAWNHLPSNWNILNSFGVNQKMQDLNIQLWKFKHAVFAGGDFRIVQKLDGTVPLYFGIRGSWGFTDDQICDLSRDIISGERKFWNEDASTRLEIILPVEGYEVQIAETRSDAISLFLSSTRKIDYRLKHSLARDYFQNWIADGIVYAEPQPLVYWFQKGFSNYYARLILLRTGLITLDEYVDDFNTILDRYFTSPMRYEKNERLVKEYWTDPDLQMLPSLRGDIFAHNLNYDIIRNSQAGKSLDDLMRDLYNRCHTESLIISNGSLSAMIRYYAGDAALAHLMRTLNSKVETKVVPGALGPCFQLEIQAYRRFWILGEYYEVPVFRYIDRNNRTLNCIGWFQIN